MLTTERLIPRLLGVSLTGLVTIVLVIICIPLFGGNAITMGIAYAAQAVMMVHYARHQGFVDEDLIEAQLRHEGITPRVRPQSYLTALGALIAGTALLPAIATAIPAANSVIVYLIGLPYALAIYVISMLMRPYRPVMTAFRAALLTIGGMILIGTI